MKVILKRQLTFKHVSKNSHLSGKKELVQERQNRKYLARVYSSMQKKYLFIIQQRNGTT